jgi:hypothetical protein
MTVTLTPHPIPSQDAKEDEISTIELEWMELQKKIETHPRYAQAVGISSAGPKELTDEDVQAIDLWKNSSGADRAKNFNALSVNAKDLASKILRGVESYVVFYPVVRRTTPIGKAPSSASPGKIENPPPEIRISGYQFLKTADRFIRKGTHWSEVEEWTGAEFIDPDFYQTGF